MPVPKGLQAGSATAPHSPAAPAPSSAPAEERDAEPDTRAAVGGLLPEDWAALFRERRDILDPVLPWLRRELSAIYGTRWWQARAAESFVLHTLCLVGPDGDAMIQHTQLGLGPLAVPLARGLVNAIAGLCGEEAGRLLGLKSSHAARAREDSPAAASQPNASVQGAASTSPAPSNSDTGPDVEELPSTSRALWRGGAGKVPAATNPQEQEEPREELGQQAAAGPSAQGCRCSSSTPRLRGPSNPGSTAGQAVPRTASCPARGCLSSTSSRAPGDLKSKNNKIYDCSTEKACVTQKHDSNKSWHSHVHAAAFPPFSWCRPCALLVPTVPHTHDGKLLTLAMVEATLG